MRVRWRGSGGVSSCGIWRGRWNRLLTYAEGEQLSEEQMTALRSELEAGATVAEVLEDFGLGSTRGFAG